MGVLAKKGLYLDIPAYIKNTTKIRHTFYGVKHCLALYLEFINK